jgi:hypothetical protein
MSQNYDESITLDNSPVIDSNRVLLNGYDAVVY